MRLIGMVLLAILANLGFAQNIDDLGGGNARPTIVQRGPISWSAPFELALGENGWESSGGPYSKSILFGLIAEMIKDEWGSEIGSSTLEILEEGAQRDALINSKWVKATSQRLQEQTMEVSETLVEIATGGSNGGGSLETSISLGGVNVAVESGSATAVIVVTLKDLTSTRRPITLVGKAKYGSTNLSSLRIDRLFAGFDIGDRFRLDKWDDNPEFRRGMIATTRALEDLRKQMRALKASR